MSKPGPIDEDRQPFHLPDEVVIDLNTGYALNVPLGRQLDAWFLATPAGLALVNHIVSERKGLGILLEDDEIFDVANVDPNESNSAMDFYRDGGT
jgi:hypothetical protein